MKEIKLRISGSGIALNGLRALGGREELYDAKAAISCLHDALLAVARGTVTPAEIRDFFWHRDLDAAKFFGEVITFTEGS
jgi:hypothetical protein